MGIFDDAIHPPKKIEVGPEKGDCCDDLSEGSGNIFGFPDEAFRRPRSNEWSFDRRPPSPGVNNPGRPVVNDSGLTGRYDETSYHKRRLPRGIAPHFLRPKGPAITKEFLKGSEVTNPDPFHFEDGLTGRYDESRRAFPKVGRGPNLVRLMRGVPRPPDFQHIHEENKARYGDLYGDDMEYCPTCQCFVPKEIIVENPSGDRDWPYLCRYCAEETERHLTRCPNCNQPWTGGEFPHCDRCGRSGCDCLHWQCVPHTFGAWMDEEYDSWDTLCGECYQSTEEEHQRRREESEGQSETEE
ncbi:MAG: hypothetical protein HY645_14825 [Acidobacteria bacterium]|nr:hypothetical protein [Acidobacteriota bacterium]